MYKVKVSFTDMQDNGHMYHVGDEFPRKGYEPEKRRIDELSGSSNRRGEPLIEAVKNQLGENTDDDSKSVEEPDKAPGPKRRGRKKAE